MVFAWSARFAEMRGAAALECVPERISEQLSRDSRSAMHSDLHLGAPLRAFRNSRTPCANHHAVADA
eukprot:9379144-Lingulodinium_polyedra.AAC.1